jgi:hypothetical protein
VATAHVSGTYVPPQPGLRKVDATDALRPPPQNGAANRGTKVPLTLATAGFLVALARPDATWANVGAGGPKPAAPANKLPSAGPVERPLPDPWVGRCLRTPRRMCDTWPCASRGVESFGRPQSAGQSRPS